MDIFIPSTRRAQLMRTWGHLPTKWRKKAVVVVPTEQKAEYSSQGWHVVGCPGKGIGPTRQWVIDHSRSPVLMLDDDLEFFERRVDDPTKLIKADHNSVERMLDKVEELTKRYAHGGITTREGANRDTSHIIYNTRNLRALFYDPKVLRKHNIRFDRVPVMEDFDVALQLLRHGYESAKLNTWAQDQPGSNTEGGCSTYRTLALQAKAAHKLADLHYGFVTVVEKEPLKSGGWNGQPRTDVRVAWKKAYDDAL